MDEDKFFNQLLKYQESKEGIPNVDMNIPVAVDRGHKGTIGLEIEIEGENLPNDGHLNHIKGKETGAIWLATKDGMLRGEAREYIFDRPCSKGEVKDLLIQLFESFKVYRSKLDLSNRCSTHVHINMSRKYINQVTSVIALWGVFEEAIIKNFCGEDRTSNHYCLSLQDSETLIKAWQFYLDTGKPPVDKNAYKYSALNVVPLWDLGSIEFRCGPAVDEPETPSIWALFLDHFVDYVTKKYPNPQTIAHEMSELGGWQMFSTICGEDHEEMFQKVTEGYSHREFDSLCMRGFRNIQPLVLGYPWDKWLPLIQRPHIPNPFDKKVKKIVINKARAAYVDAPLQPAPRFRDADLQQQVEEVNIRRQVEEAQQQIRQMYVGRGDRG